MRPEKIVEDLSTKTIREAEQGKRFRYATIETEILGRVLGRAAGMTVTQMTEEWLWKPMGAEHEARWLLAGADNGEGTGGSFNATLRDYGRFGLLLANDGQRDGVQVIPRDYLMDATDPVPYTQLTLPTKREVEITVVRDSIKNTKNETSDNKVRICRQRCM